MYWALALAKESQSVRTSNMIVKPRSSRPFILRSFIEDARRSENVVLRRGFMRAHCDASVLASSATAQGTSVMAVATDADYQRDPTRWGSAEMAAHFPGFRHLDMRTSGAIIRLRHGGSGPPLLLVHGNPENHTCWYKVAGKLAEQFHVVLPDLRGYGDSSLPDPGPNNINFSFREMARDLVEA